MKSYSLEKLPEKYHGLYKYAKQVITILKQKTIR